MHTAFATECQLFHTVQTLYTERKKLFILIIKYLENILYNIFISKENK